MTKLTQKQKAILAVLLNDPQGCSLGITPTKIGQACGKDYGRASAWACSGLKPLVADKYVLRYVALDNSVLYSLTSSGKALAQDQAS